MDSLTQLALGAAVGEATLGRKLGNRAMVWGAFGGLLPDFDVLANLFTDELSALAFHRGFMHSFVFSVLAALSLGWMVHRLYDSGFYRRKIYKGAVCLFVLSIYLLLGLGLRMILKSTFESPVVIAVFLSGAIVIGILLWARYFTKDLSTVRVSRKECTWLFSLAIVTHPLLDNFTTFGTQLFQPFSDYRVSFSNISVVDPAYTIWLLIGIGAAAFIHRQRKARCWWNWAGIALSSAYMVFTLFNKIHVDAIFEATLKEQGISYQRYTTGPAILNNFLWNGLAEGDTAYYVGQYSNFDEEKRFSGIRAIPKNHHLLNGHEEYRALRILSWFSNGYYNVITRQDGKRQLNDLRFGSFDGTFDDEKDYIFKFIFEENNGELTAQQVKGDRKIDREELRKYFRRIAGVQG